MSSVRVAFYGLVTWVCVGLEPAAARADIPGPYPWSKYKRADPNDFRPPAVKSTDQPATPTPPQQPVQKSGPFRSCGSGIGTGLAGIGLAWMVMWTGNHFARRVRRR